MTRLRRNRQFNQIRTLILVLAVVLPMLCATRLLGQTEDDVGYRKSFYQEDGDRIHVATDNWQFNVGLRKNIRVSGNVVLDAITGATPNGAPPQSQWPFPSYEKFYQTAYADTYKSQYNLFVSQNAAQVDAGFWTPQELTNYASQFANSVAPTVASNSAASSFQSLTNNPNYRRNKVPLSEMHDRRTAFSIQLPMTFGNHEITPSFSYSEESDYISYGGALNYSLALNEKNTLLNAGWSHNQDNVRDDVFQWQDKMTDDFFIGLIQLFGPKAYLTVNASMGFSHGYLNDPYRGVIAATNFDQTNPDDPELFPESRPRHRNTYILYASWTQFITPLNAGYDLSYRFFHDTYGINAQTIQLDWHQKIGKQLVLSPTCRYYYQNAADFYYVLIPDFNNKPNFYSADYRLSEFDSFAAGVTLSWRFHKHLSLDLAYMRYWMAGLDNKTSQSAYPNANIYSFGLRGWF